MVISLKALPKSHKKKHKIEKEISHTDFFLFQAVNIKALKKEESTSGRHVCALKISPACAMFNFLFYFS